ncbi:MAG: NUDIX hydrolase [Anaerolineae bacterium]|nr:NUDIX hydrolase [Anaerolineae bacterium]
MMKLLVRVWREFPIGLQVFIARVIRPRFRVAIAAFIFDEQDRLLLCEHTYRKSHPWGLPAGGLEYGEDPEDGVKREVKEETGFEVQVDKLLYADSAKEFRHISLIYLCRVLSGSFEPNLEISRIQFYNLDQLPKLLPTEKVLIDKMRTKLSL